MKILVDSLCKIGGREYNQDFVLFSVKENGACFVLCDGLGSYAGSEVASRVCAERVVEDFEKVNFADSKRVARAVYCEAYIENAHFSILAAKEKNHKIGGSCTTVAAAVTSESGTRLMHIGDSRVYFFKQDKIEYQSKDHSLSQVAVDLGEITTHEIRSHKDQNKLTRVVGSDYFIQPDAIDIEGPLMAGDSILLCSDGFWEYVFEEEMEDDIATSETPKEAIEKMEKRLLGRIKPYNDNYSVVLAMAKDE